MGMVGAAVITIWALGLLKETAPVLLDASIDEPEQHSIKAAMEQDSDNRVSDMHIWKVGENHYAAIIAVVTIIPNRLSITKICCGNFTRSRMSRSR